MTLREKRKCRQCGKEIQPYLNKKKQWVIKDYCNNCKPEEQLHELTCKKCNKTFLIDHQRTDRKFCPECSTMNQDTKELTCPKCGKIYFTERTPDGRHFKHKRVCDECSKVTTEKIVYCEKCGKPFTVTKYPGTDSFKKVRFCSDLCASTQTEFVNGKVQWKKAMQTCKHCGKSFELKRTEKGTIRKREVCDDCLKPKTKAKTKEKVCSVCGKMFEVELTPCGNYSSTQYCSDECANIGFKTKCKTTCQEKYGVDYPCLTDKAIKHNAGNVISEINKRFAKMLDENNIKYVLEFKIENYSYDFKIKDTDYLVEINPTYTHNSYYNHFGKVKDKNYHHDKTKFAFDNNYICICVWDWDDWNKIIKLIKQNNIKIKETKIQLHYSKNKENIIVLKENKDYIEKGYLPIYDDGFTIIITK